MPKERRATANPTEILTRGICACAMESLLRQPHSSVSLRQCGLAHLVLTDAALPQGHEHFGVVRVGLRPDAVLVFGDARDPAELQAEASEINRRFQLGVVIPGAGDGVESCMAAACYISPSILRKRR